jgi:hypothetical protein
MSVLTALLAPAGPAGIPRVGYPSRDPALDVLPGFVSPPPGYGSVAFYWWLGDPLTKERISWQLEQLRGAGVMGLQVNYAHGAKGNRWYGPTYPSEPPLFSPAWWDLFGWLMGEAGKQGAALSLSDYTLCVPGQGWWNDEIIKGDPALRGSVLRCARRDLSGPRDFSWDLWDQAGRPVSVVAYRTDKGAIRPGSGVDLRPRVAGSALRWQAPEGSWRIVAVFPEVVPLSLDPLNPAAGRKVVEKFFQRFEDRFPGQSGRGLNFFFSDELSLGINDEWMTGTLWSARIAAEFRRRKGYDLAPELPALFLDVGPRTPKVRLDYRDVMVSLSEEGYFRPIFEWHADRGMLYGCDHGWRGSNVVEFGDYFRTQRWTLGPGNDSPGLEPSVIRKNKVNSSIAHLYERPRVWLEGFHSSGWGTTTSDLTADTAKNFVAGANLLALHGLYYSTHGGWWEWAPPCNYFRMPYWPHTAAYLRYCERLSYLLSQGVHRCDVAVMYPVAPMEAGMGGQAASDTAFGIGDELFGPAGRGIDFDFMDFESLARAEISGRELRVAGEAYRVLVLPAMAAVRYSTMQKTREFFRAGGLVIAVGVLPEASDRQGREDPELDAMVKEVFGVTAREAATTEGRRVERNAAGGAGWRLREPAAVPGVIADALPLDFALVEPAARRHCQALHRKAGPRDVYMVLGAPKGAECFFRAKGKVELWDPWTGDVRPIRGVSVGPDGTRVRMPLEDSEAQLIVFSPGALELNVEKSDLDEITSVEAKDGRMTVEGYAATAGRKEARVRRGGELVEVWGDAPAPPAPVALDRLWEFELKPTLDNRFGDYRWPPTGMFISAEARRFRYAEETAGGDASLWSSSAFDDSAWRETSCSYGPQFWQLGPLPPAVDTSELKSGLLSALAVDPGRPVEIAGRKLRWQPYEFSLRWGVEGKPGEQGYHGLKEIIHDEFFDLPNDKPGSVWYLWTGVRCPRDGRFFLRTGNMGGGVEAWLDGAATLPDKPLDLRRGAHRLLVRLTQSSMMPMRAYAALSPTPPPAVTPIFSSAASYVWYPGAPEAAAPFFRKDFRPGEDLKSAKLRITADDSYTVYLNGKETGRGDRCLLVQEYDVRADLARGRNILCVRARNESGLAGLIAELTLLDSAGRRTSVATDATWRCALETRPDWLGPGFDDSRWTAAAPISRFENSPWYPTEPGPHFNHGVIAGPPMLEVDPHPRFVPSELRLRWFADPEAPIFDCRPGDSRRAGWYRFTAPPGLRSLDFVCFGEVGAWSSGRELTVEGGARRPDGARRYRAAVARVEPGPVNVALRVEQEPGRYAGAAFPEPVKLECGPGQAKLGDWSRLGVLAHYSGGAWYRKFVTLTREQTLGRVRLQLGRVAATAEVHVNGQLAGIRVAPPWTVDISKFVRPGENRVEILVYNTLANHYGTIPTRYRGSPVSGLLGPVRIETRPLATLISAPPGGPAD